MSAKILITNPQTETLDILYSGLARKGGGTLIVRDPDMRDSELVTRLTELYNNAAKDHINLCVFFYCRREL